MEIHVYLKYIHVQCPRSWNILLYKNYKIMNTSLEAHLPKHYIKSVNEPNVTIVSYYDIANRPSKFSEAKQRCLGLLISSNTGNNLPQGNSMLCTYAEQGALHWKK